MNFLTIRKPLNRFRPVPYVVTSGAVICVAYGLAYLSYLPPEAVQQATPIWPIGAIFLALYYVWGTRAAPVVILSTLLTNTLIADRPLWLGVAFAASSLIGLQLSASILGPARGRGEDISHFSETARLVVAAMVMPLINTIVGVTYIVVTFGHSYAAIPELFAKWWMGFFLGILLVTPLLLAWWRRPSVSVREALRCLVVTFVAAPLVYFILYTPSGEGFIFGLFPLLLVASRYVPRHLFLTLVFLLNVAAIHATVLGFGPFNAGSVGGNLTNLQVFLGTVSVTAAALEGFTRGRPFRISTLALLSGWLLSGMIYYLFSTAQAEKDLRQAKILASNIESEISDRFRYLETSLRLMSAFIGNTGSMDRDTWLAYFADLKIARNFPGIRRVGIMQTVGSTNGVASTQFVVTFAAPENATNRRLEGLHLADLDLDLQEAIVAAALRGESILTQDINFSNSPKSRDVVGLYVPFFTLGKSVTLHGVVFASLDLERFFSIIFNRVPREVSAVVFDGQVGESKATFVSDATSSRLKSDFDFLTTMDIGRRLFTIGWKKALHFPSTRDATGAVLSASAALLTLFLAMILFNLMVVGERAEQLAAKRTKELEEQRAAVAHAAKLSSLGEMAGGIAHEINNPLTIIHGTSQMLQKSYREQKATPESLMTGLKAIEDTAMRISKIVRGMRALSHSGENDPVRMEKIAPIVEQTLWACAERFKADGIELIVDPIPDIAIPCRATQIGQVLLNFLNNGHDAVMTTSSKKWLRLSFQERNNTIAISVTDSGPGVPKDVRERIFQPFYSTKEGVHGLGLGLSISMTIASAHHGRLYLDENSAETRFVLELPKSLPT